MNKFIYFVVFLCSIFFLGCDMPVRYTVTFDSDGAGEIESISVAEGMKITEPITPIKEGYNFEGWFVGEEKWVFVGYTVTNDMTLKARWTPKEYTITFDTNGGEELDPIKVKYGEKIVLENPCKLNNIFIGWDKEVPDTMPNCDLSLKASWIDANAIEIVYDSVMLIGSESIIEVNVLSDTKLEDLRFISSDEGIIEISENKMKAISNGTCNIYVYTGDSLIKVLNINVKKVLFAKEEILNSNEIIEIEVRVPHTTSKILIESFIEDFEKEYNGKIKIILENYYDSDNLLKQNLNDIKNNKAPNITLVYSNHINAYNDLNVLLELDKYLENDNIDLSTFVDGFINKIDETNTYSLPFYISTDVLVYNKTVFDKMGYKVPTTWEELETLAKQIYEDAKNGLLDGYSEVYKPSEYVKNNMFYSFSYDSLIDCFENISKYYEFPYVEIVNNNEAKAAIYNEKTIEVLEHFQDLTNNYLFSISYNFELNYTSEAFTEMRCMMTSSSSAGVVYCIPRYETFEIGVAPLPTSEDKSIKATGLDLCIFNQSTDIENFASWEFIKYITNIENSSKIISQYGYFPVRKDSYETKNYKDAMNKQYYLGEVAKVGLEYAKSYKYFNYDSLKGIEDIRVNIEYAFAKIIAGNANVKETIYEVINNIDK